MTSPDILIFGYGKMPADCARILLDHSQPIVGIWETEQSKYSALKGFCLRRQVPYQSATTEQITSLLRGLKNQTAILSINNNYIFPKDIILKKQLRIVNFHSSLLPAYPGHGRIISTWVIFNGETHHGATWHLVSEGIDAGNILCQASFPVSRKDTALKVMMAAIELGIKLFRDEWEKLLDFSFFGRPQGRRPTRVYRERDLPNGGYFDISWDFCTGERFLRSMDYGPFAGVIKLPRVKYGNREFVISRYQVRYKSNGKSQGLLWSESHGEDPDSLELLYPQGSITLLLKTEGKS